MDTTRLCLLLAVAGHLLCWHCDRLISYAPGGRFSMDAIKENEKMAAMYRGMPLRRMEVSMLLGVAAMTLELFGYLAVAEWLRPRAAGYAAVLWAAAGAAFVSGVVHHVLCGAVLWFYVKLDCTEQAREAVLTFFRQTSPVMAVCFVGMLAYAVALFAAVVTGAAGLPRWACVFNLAVLFAALSPLRIVGTLNLAGAGMCLGLLLLV